MDWTLPISIAVFFAGLVAVLLVALPRARVAMALSAELVELRGRVTNVAVDLSTFKQKDMEKVRQDLDGHQKQISSLQNTLAVKQLGGR